MKNYRKTTLNIENSIDELKELIRIQDQLKQIAEAKMKDLQEKINKLNRVYLEEKEKIYDNISNQISVIKEECPQLIKNNVLKVFSADIKIKKENVKVKRNTQKLVEFINNTNPQFVEGNEIDWENYCKLLVRKDDKFIDDKGNEVEGLYIKKCNEIEIILKNEIERILDEDGKE